MLDLPTMPYNRTRMPRTALASFPRSGNSYVRSLVEKASGYQTSSVYCDKRLKPAFKGECDGLHHPWLVKVRKSITCTKLAAAVDFPQDWPTPSDNRTTDHWSEFDQAVRLIRNPIE